MSNQQPLRQMREISCQVGGDTADFRTETFNGRDYLVVPLVMLVEGVIQGANALNPEFCSAGELEKAPQGWNGRPIVMNHPQINGQFVSANIPQVLEEWSFGYVFAAQVSKAKLQAEAWIDTELAAERGGDFQDAVDRINAGQVVEVSTGLFTEVISQKGKFNQARYSGVWRGIVPDHLAILSDGIIGACSVEDGCGIPRLNTQALRTNLSQPKVNCGGGADCSCGCSDGGPGVAKAKTAKTAVPVSAPLNLSSVDAIAVNDGTIDGGNNWNPDPAAGGKVGGGEGPSRTTEMAALGIDPLLPPAGTGTGETVPISLDDDSDAGEDFDMVSDDANAEASSKRPTRPADTSFTTMAKRALKAYGDRCLESLQSTSGLRGNALASTVVFSDVSSILSQALRTQYEVMNGWMYVCAVTTDVVVVSCYDDNWDAITYQIAYSMDDSGNVTFTGEPEPVMLMTRIVAQPSSGMTTNSGAPETETSQGDQSMTTKVATGQGGAPAESVDPSAAPIVNAAPTVQSVDDYIAAAPPAIREMMTASMKVFQDHKSALIGKIMANARNKFTDVQLQGFDVSVLENMAELAFEAPPLNTKPLSSGRGGNTPVNNSQAAPEAPADYSGRAAPAAEPTVLQEESGLSVPEAPKVFEGKVLSRFRQGVGMNAGRTTGMNA